MKLAGLFTLAAVAVISLPGTNSAMAQSDIPDVVSVDVLPGWRTKDGTHMAGVRVRLAPGWKTYWRSPGEGGIPPEFDLSGSANIRSARAHWPRPQVFDQNGFRSIGYKNEVIFPLEITPEKAGAPITVLGTLDLGVCEDVCIPVSAPLSAGLDSPGVPNSAIREALAQVPDRIDATVKCELEPIDDGMKMTASIPLKKEKGEVAVIELDDLSVWVSPSVTERRGGALHATVDMVPSSGQPFAVDRSTVRVTVLSDNAAYEMRGCVSG